MVRWLVLVFLLAFAGSTAATCNWGGLGYNPWTRWNVFSLSDIGASVLPQGADFQGRLAARGNVYLESFSLHDIAQSPSFAFSATAGGSFDLYGGSVFNGGVEAGGNIRILSADVHGDVNSVAGNVIIGDPSHNSHIFGKVQAGGTATKSALSTVDNGVTSNVAGLSLSADLNAVANFYLGQSAFFKSKANTVTPTFGNDITVTLAAGVNYATATATQLKAASRLLLQGSNTGILIINVAGATVTLDGLDVCQGNGNPCVYPGSGRVLLNFWQATALNIPSFSGYLSILAPNAALTYSAGVITGNVIAYLFKGEFAGGNQVNVLPFNAPCPPASPPAVPATPPPPPSPQGTGGVPSPPSPCSCPWDSLGYNPWKRWNVFSGLDIGTSAAPQGADFQGRFAAVRNGWFKAFSGHTVAQPPDTPWSASFGGTFSLIGGSILNGGVEAGGNIVIKSANVDGTGLKSVAGNINLGDATTSATVIGSVRAGGTATKSAGSYVSGVFLSNQNTLALSVDLLAAKAWFEAVSTSYGSLPNTAGTIVEYDAHGATTKDPPSSDSLLHTLTVTLVNGINVITVTASRLKYASTLYLKGSTTGVLIINVAGTTISDFNGLDVYDHLVGGADAAPATGRVLINLYQATSVTISAVSGRFSLLAPKATLTYSQGVIEGNVVVYNLLSLSTGSGQVNAYPWNPPCPICVASQKFEVLAQPPDGDGGDKRQALAQPPDDHTDKRQALARPPDGDGGDLRQTLAQPPDGDSGDLRRTVAQPPDDHRRQASTQEIRQQTQASTSQQPSAPWALLGGALLLGMAIGIAAGVAHHRKQACGEPTAPAHMV